MRTHATTVVFFRNTKVSDEISGFLVAHAIIIPVKSAVRAEIPCFGAFVRWIAGAEIVDEGCRAFSIFNMLLALLRIAVRVFADFVRLNVIFAHLDR